MGKDPYLARGFTSSPYHAKSPVSGTLCAVLDLSIDDRGLELIPQPSRALCNGEVHELLMTDELDAAPGGRVDRVTGLAFFVVEEPGVVLRNDVVCVNGVTLGRLAGFDETHAPNHYNLIVLSQSRRTGKELNLELGASISFNFNLSGVPEDT